MEEDVFNSLRSKLAIGIIVVFGSILALLITAFNLYLAYSNTQSSKAFIEELVENNGIMISAEDVKKDLYLTKQNVSSADKSSNPEHKTQQGFRDFFSARIDFLGNITEVISNFQNKEYADEKYTAKLVKEVLNRHSTKGNYTVFGYMIVEEPSGYLIILLDRKDDIDQQMNFAYISIAIFAIALLISYFLAWLFAMKAVKPVEESYIKQKQFIADASHELKTPIAVIGANIDVLKNEIPNNKWVNYIETENTRMSALVKDLLYLAKNDVGRDKLQMLPFDFVECVNVAALPFESVAFEQGKLFELEMPKTSIPVLADEAKIKQTVIILIDNALKNTDRGGRIKVTVSSEGKQNVVKVFNSGHGIAPEDIGKIFDRFYRADSSRDRNTGGYGLGLSIAQTIAKAHGGKITVYSRVDEYAEFVLSLPKKIN